MNLSSFRTEYGRNVTTYRLGGKIKFYAPTDESEFCEAVDFLNKTDNSFTALGAGSKILFADEEYGGYTLSTENLKGTYFSGGLLTVYAGVRVYEVIRFCIDNGLSGLEYLAKIPATIGGIAALNAGAFGKNFSDSVKFVTVLRDGGVTTVCGENGEYRKPFINDGDVVISATCVVESAPKERVKSTVKSYVSNRMGQPTGRSCGSFFKNPAGDYAGRLIEKAGLKGYRVGGAVVSDKHANFIISDGAFSQDVKKLADICEYEVANKFGVKLEKEVKLIGDFR